MEFSPEIWAAAHELVARQTNSSTNGTSASSPNHTNRPPIYKVIGLCLAIASGLFIGTSFVLKKTGLLRANAKYHEEAGEGYGYLKNAYWWTGMTLMIIGEICNFVAYAFTDAILVTPLGALSVVVTTILSTIFLKERLSFIGKIGCFNCIIGSVVIVMNAPEQSSVADIQEMKRFFITPGFLTYAGIIIVGSAFIAWWAGPRYGKKSMLVYLSICSFIGGLSVVATQGLGSAVVAQAGGKAQFNQWFLYVLLVFVVCTLVTEIIYLNKALNLFNAALVTPTYYVFFTSTTIVTSAILFQGFHGTGISIATVVMGFLQICSGVVLLQLSKSAKDVPDAAVFKGDLDQVREVAEQEQPESEPKADAIRGTAALIRRISVSRQRMAEQEAKRLREEKLADHLEPLRENEVVEWDGLRRRKTIMGDQAFGPPIRRKTLHPPLGMSRFPEEGENDNDEERDSQGFFESLRNRTASVIHPNREHAMSLPVSQRNPMYPVPMTEINVNPSKMPDTPIYPGGPGSLEDAKARIHGLPSPGPNPKTPYSPRSKPLPAKPSSSSLAPEPPPHSTRRQFSFSNVFHRSSRSPEPPTAPKGLTQPPSRAGLGSRGSSTHDIRRAMKNATEEERLGLVKGDSSHALPLLEESVNGSPSRATSSSPVRKTVDYPYTYEDDETSSPQAPTFHSTTPSSTNRPLPAAHFSYTTSPVLSEDDEDDEWQMTTPPPPPHNDLIPSTATQSPPRAQQRPMPRPLDLLSSSPNRVPVSGLRNVARAPIAQDRFLSSTTRLDQGMSQRMGEPPGYGNELRREESPEEYEDGGRRFEDQQLGRNDRGRGKEI